MTADVRTSDLEIYARGSARVDAVWAVVRDPRRLPAWTDVTAVEGLQGDRPVEEGDRFTTVERGRRRAWRVVTHTDRLLEVDTRLPWGALGLGVRVVEDPRAPRADPAHPGTRVVLAAAFLPGSAAGRMRWLAVGAPAVRRRFDRWSRAAVTDGVADAPRILPTDG